MFLFPEESPPEVWCFWLPLILLHVVFWQHDSKHDRWQTIEYWSGRPVPSAGLFFRELWAMQVGGTSGAVDSFDSGCLN